VGITDSQTCRNLTGRLRAMREAGFRVTLVASPGEWLDETAASEGVQCVALPMERGIAPVADLISLVRLWSLLRRLRPDMTEFSTPKAGLLGTVAAMLCGVPRRIYMLRGFRFETCVGLKRAVLLLAERVASACAHAVLCTSPSMYAQALALHVASERKLHFLGDGSSNGVDAKRFSPGSNEMRESLGIPEGAPVVGFVGRLTRDKGVLELLDAFETILKSSPSAHLLLVGWFDRADDALGADVCARIQNHPQIIFTDYVQDTAPYYRVMDVMVLPSKREGFPNAVLEAASTGISVITTLSTGSRDSVVPEVTGLLIPPGYAEAIAEAVLALLRNPERRRRMGVAARTWILERFQDRHVLGLTLDYYKSLLEPAAELQEFSPVTVLAGDRQ
jgi:glycosyltransferase involved in cell wall biosynthesis